MFFTIFCIVDFLRFYLFYLCLTVDLNSFFHHPLCQKTSARTRFLEHDPVCHLQQDDFTISREEIVDKRSKIVCRFTPYRSPTDHYYFPSGKRFSCKNIVCSHAVLKCSKCIYYNWIRTCSCNDFISCEFIFQHFLCHFTVQTDFYTFPDKFSLHILNHFRQFLFCDRNCCKFYKSTKTITFLAQYYFMSAFFCNESGLHACRSSSDHKHLFLFLCNRNIILVFQFQRWINGTCDTFSKHDAI